MTTSEKSVSVRIRDAEDAVGRLTRESPQREIVRLYEELDELLVDADAAGDDHDRIVGIQKALVSRFPMVGDPAYRAAAAIVESKEPPRPAPTVLDEFHAAQNNSARYAESIDDVIDRFMQDAPGAKPSEPDPPRPGSRHGAGEGRKRFASKATADTAPPEKKRVRMSVAFMGKDRRSGGSYYNALAEIAHFMSGQLSRENGAFLVSGYDPAVARVPITDKFEVGAISEAFTSEFCYLISEFWEKGYDLTKIVSKDSDSARHHRIELARAFSASLQDRDARRDSKLTDFDKLRFALRRDAAANVFQNGRPKAP